MLTPNVAALLRAAQQDSELGDRMRAADTYEELHRLALDADYVASPEEFRAAFVARNARVLTAQMIRNSLVDRGELPPAPGWNAELWGALQALDLRAVVAQLVSRKGWTTEAAAAAQRRYRRFLYMCIAEADTIAIPTEPIDEFWHQHILNTKLYASQCEEMAGRFIHHYPASGAEEAQSREMQDMFFETWLLYETLFDEPYAETIGEALLQRWPNPVSPAAFAA